MNNSTEQRFWAKVEKTDTCWHWHGATHKGYGRFYLSPTQRSARAHRIAHELLIGPIPDGLVIDHLCRNRACVNPAHMELVTVGENNLRGVGDPAINAAKTHCKYGHPFNAANTIHRRTRNERECRACAQRRTREHQQRKQRNP